MKSLILGTLLVLASTVATSASAHNRGCYHPHSHRCAHYGYGYASHFYVPGPSHVYKNGCHYRKCSPVVYYKPYRACHSYYYDWKGNYWCRCK